MTETDPRTIPPHARQGLETVLALHERAQQGTTRHHRILERLTAKIGQPSTLYVVLAAIGLWIGGNTLAHHWGWPCPDPPPFSGLECAASLAALLLATAILTTQNQHSRISESRSHLELQVALLAEQRLAKLIDLVEELRVDLPMVRDRRDPVAEALKQPVDPAQLAEALENHLEPDQPKKG